MNGDKVSCMLRTCVSPEGRFIYGLHNPAYSVANLRVQDTVLPLGRGADGSVIFNAANFPVGDVDEPGADPIYEIPNALPFKGTTYIGKRWADRTATDPASICIPARAQTSLSLAARTVFGDADPTGERLEQLFSQLPRPLKLALAASSSDPDDLVRLAGLSCRFVSDPATGAPAGLVFDGESGGRLQPRIHDQALFDAVANNPFLPDLYKEVMVLRPGAQGQSEITGEWRRNGSHGYEYLRRNSYIPWGHYAANMAEDAVRYSAASLSAEDMRGMRHLYYQRTYVRLAETLGLKAPARRREVPAAELEQLRREIRESLRTHAAPLPFNATLWGWNYGFDYAPNGYRLHASHQQIHQQYALIPAAVPVEEGGELPAFACGDMVHEFVQAYHRSTGRSFFDCYEQALARNRRMDGRTDRPSDLMIHRDDHVMLFVPKAQTSQWELQLMTRADVGNILEADAAVRSGLDEAIQKAMLVLTALGATMITVIEYSKRFDIAGTGQRLLYVFLPRLPESPGAFSEAQLRWINGHYPEDFALACRMKLESPG